MRDDPTRGDAGHLTYEKARLGAERLALAMILAKRRNLRSYEPTIFAEVQVDELEPGLILENWNDLEKQALLRRAIF